MVHRNRDLARDSPGRINSQGRSLSLRGATRREATWLAMSRISGQFLSQSCGYNRTVSVDLVREVFEVMKGATPTPRAGRFGRHRSSHYVSGVSHTVSQRQIGMASLGHAITSLS
jgi:hypothetical protein